MLVGLRVMVAVGVAIAVGEGDSVDVAVANGVPGTTYFTVSLGRKAMAPLFDEAKK